MSMDTQGEVEEGICFVSFDGGGPGTISQLLIIDEFMTRMTFKLQKDEDELRAADYFDLMGGVGFGGFAALLLGRLRMTPNEAMKELSTIATAVFLKKPIGSLPPETNLTQLQESIESMLERHRHLIDLKLRDDSTRCKVTPDRTFVEAACAILALPEFFSPVAIGPPLRKQMFSGIPFGFNNPMREVFKEARLIFGDKKRVSLVLSIGSGQQTVLSKSEQHTTLWTRVTRDCDTVARELSHQLSSAGAYLRLNVDKGMENIKPSEWHSLGSIESHTNVYLQMSVVTAHVDEASQWLLKRIGSVTLGELNGNGRHANTKFQSKHLSDQLAIEVKQMSNIVQQGLERITLVDAIGNRIPIPMQLCRTYKLLTSIIQSYFEHQRPPGSKLVKRGEYQLISGTTREVVKSGGWTNMIESGLTVEMSMILYNRRLRGNCPRCGLSAGGPRNDDSCQVQFQITDQITRDYVHGSLAVRRTGNTYPSHPSETEKTDGETDEWTEYRLLSLSAILETTAKPVEGQRNVFQLDEVTSRSLINDPWATIDLVLPEGFCFDDLDLDGRLDFAGNSDMDSNGPVKGSAMAINDNSFVEMTDHAIDPRLFDYGSSLNDSRVQLFGRNNRLTKEATPGNTQLSPPQNIETSTYGRHDMPSDGVTLQPAVSGQSSVASDRQQLKRKAVHEVRDSSGLGAKRRNLGT